MNQNEFNEMWVKIAKENPEFVFESNQNPAKESCDVTISTKEGNKIAWVHFHYVLKALKIPVEDLSQLVTKFEYEYTGYDTRATKEDIDKFVKALDETL